MGLLPPPVSRPTDGSKGEQGERLLWVVVALWV